MRFATPDSLYDSVLTEPVHLLDITARAPLVPLLRSLVAELRLRGSVSGAYLAYQEQLSWEGLDSRLSGRSTQRHNGIPRILPAVEYIMPRVGGAEVAVRTLCATHQELLPVEGVTTYRHQDGGVVLKASCWAYDPRDSRLYDPARGHIGVPPGWAYLGGTVLLQERGEVDAEPPVTLTDLGLSRRVRNALIRAGIGTVPELCAHSQGDLWRVPGIGLVATREIARALADHGLHMSWRCQERPTIRRAPSAEVRAKPIEALKLAVAIERVLVEEGITQVGQLLDHTLLDLVHSPGIGEDAALVINYELNQRGLALRTSDRVVHQEVLAEDPSVPLLDLNHAGMITASAARALRRAGVQDVGALSALTEEDLLAISGIGPATVARLREALARIGFTLREGEEDT